MLTPSAFNNLEDGGEVGKLFCSRSHVGVRCEAAESSNKMILV